MLAAAHDLPAGPNARSPEALPARARGRTSRRACPRRVRGVGSLRRRPSARAPGSEVHLEGLPPEVVAAAAVATQECDWAPARGAWAERHARSAVSPLLD